MCSDAHSITLKECDQSVSLVIFSRNSSRVDICHVTASASFKHVFFHRQSKNAALSLKPILGRDTHTIESDYSVSHAT